MNETISLFLQDSREQLDKMKANDINGFFRARRAVKDDSCVIEYHFIEQFTRRIATLLDSLHSGNSAVSPQLATLLLECCDQLGGLIDQLATAQPQSAAELIGRGQALTLRLKAIIASETGAAAPQALNELDLGAPTDVPATGKS